jgi:acyl-coenzyme A synthetase/AMP-(fatty) acid ligase
MFLGVLWSGNYYVALDESFETERLTQMVDTVNPVGILWYFNPKNYNMASIATDLYDDMELTQPDKMFLQSISENCEYQTPLYGVFTSGTTGNPKCIVKSHGAMVEFITNYVKLFGFRHDDILGSKLSLMFDAITKDLYTTLYCGCTMHIMARGNTLPSDDAAYMVRNRITSVVWTPSLLINFCKMHLLEKIKFNALRRVLFVGEALPTKYMNYWVNYCPNVKFVNLYGTSEMTGNCLYGEVNAQITSEVVPLNQQFPGYHVWMIDDEGDRITTPQSKGEIVVSGKLLCLEQLGTSTAQGKFIETVDEEGNNCRAYITGDIVKIDENGNYSFLGRSDYRFKHAGYRIEPGEIEEIMTRCDCIEECVVLYDPVRMRIDLFWTGDQTKQEQVVIFAQEKLQKHMLPGKYIYLEEFPMNSNGKISRAGLNERITKGEFE